MGLTRAIVFPPLRMYLLFGIKNVRTLSRQCLAAVHRRWSEFRHEDPWGPHHVQLMGHAMFNRLGFWLFDFTPS